MSRFDCHFVKLKFALESALLLQHTPGQIVHYGRFKLWLCFSFTGQI